MAGALGVAMLLVLLPGCGATATLAQGLTQMLAPTKGNMTGLFGEEWTLRVDPSAALALDFLPAEPAELGAARRTELEAAVLQSHQYLKDFARWRAAVLAGGFYTSGKGFQKVGTVCLLLERFFSMDDERTVECTDWLQAGFKCYYDPVPEECQGAPASYYDGDWGGIVSRFGWDAKDGNSDYGNVDYNDHHYHYGYFIVSGAILAHLKPIMLEHELFTAYVNTLIRDTANPSMEDPHFPQFRTFDWFDLHSWSHGIDPMYDGKDQESTSEELNLLYGLTLWGKVTSNLELAHLGATMLTLAANTVREFFLMKTGNPYHPKDFVKNHVTGIFLQGKVDYTTWFGGKPEHIHGIQMLPLSPALELTRTKEFCQQEWDDVLSHADLGAMTKPWASVVLTGSLAFLDPELAYSKLLDFEEGELDGGLTRAWALYWTATRPGESVLGSSSLSTAPSDTNASTLALPGDAAVLPTVSSGSFPHEFMFPKRSGHPIRQPLQTKVSAPIATNKFWASWVVQDGEKFPIYPMPYMLNWDKSFGSPVLQIAHSTPSYVYSQVNPDRIKTYISPFVPDLFMGAKEAGLAGPTVVSEGLFGAKVEVAGPGGATITFPVYSGMAYISGKYSGGVTPWISHHHGIARITKAAPGTWSFTNRRGAEYRVYALTFDGAFVDDSFDFDEGGALNQVLEGWMRVALVNAADDTEVLDTHAQAVVVDCELDVRADGTVQYKFKKEGSQTVPLLHWAFGHHLQLMSWEEAEPAEEAGLGPLLL